MPNDHKMDELIFNSIENLIVVVDASGHILRMNAATERVTGYSFAESAGKKVWEIFNAEPDRAGAQERLAKLITGEWPLRYSREWVSRDGDRRMIRWSIAIARDADGVFQYLVATGTDITDSLRIENAEKALRDQARLLRSVLESVGDGVAVVDAAGEFLVYTPELERIVGRPQPSVSREHWPEYFGFYLPDGVTPFPAGDLPMARAMAGEASNEVEIQMRHPQWTEPRWCSVNGRPLRDESGRVCGGVIASREITARKRAEGEIRFRKSLLESQMEASIDGVLVVDPNGKILLSNTRFATMLKIPEDVVRKGIDEDALAIVVGLIEDPDEFLARVKWLYEHPEEQSSEEMRFKDGRIIDRFSCPVRTLPGEGLPIVDYGRVWIFRDITELKLAEAAARKSAEVARRDEAHFREMADHTRRLAREIDHRVGNNLAALLGLVSVTRSRALSVDALADAIQNRLLAMAQVHQLLREGSWKRVSLSELITSAFTTIAHDPHGKVKLTVAGPDVAVEPRQVSPLTMVLVELLTNSAKHGVYGAAGGRLSLTWEVSGGPSQTRSGTVVRLLWSERDGPPIVGPVIASLGTELVEGFITHELRGKCELRYPREGATHIFEFPLAPPEEQDSEFSD